MKESLSTRLALQAIFAFFAALGLVGTINAQEKNWRPIAPEDLQAEKAVVEPDADAEALFWDIRVDDSSSDDVDISHYVRVKIFNERGREKYSRFDIPYVKGVKIKNLAARVTRPDGSTTEIGKKDIFDREIVRASGVKVKAKSFAVPNLEPGSIVEYKYREAVDEAGASGMRLPLQRDIPVRELVYWYKPYGKRDPQYQAYNLSDFKFQKQAKNFWRAARHNVPSFKSEPRMPPEDTVRPWLLLTSTRVRVQWTSGTTFNVIIKDPKVPTLYWGSYAMERRQTLDIILKEDSAVTKAAQAITAGATTPEEKLRRLYDFCQKEIKNLAYDPSIPEQPLKKGKEIKTMADILESKEARAPGLVDWLFAALASSLGMDTHFVYTGNKSEIFFDPNMANESLLHHSAIAVTTDDGVMFFNPGDPFLPFGMIPWHDEDSWALLVSKDSQRWMKTPIADRTKNHYKRKGTFKLNEEGALEGTVEVHMTGQPAHAYRQSNWEEPHESLEKFLSEEVRETKGTAEVSEIKIENLRDPNKPLIQRYKLVIPNYASKTGSRIFLQPGVFEHGRNAMFSSNSRSFGVFFPYPWSETDELTIALPNGFELDNPERPFPVNDPDNVGSLAITISIDRAKNTLIYKRDFKFGMGSTLYFPKEVYAPVKGLFDAMQKANTHTLALKRATETAATNEEN